jgi:hypothetical protein
MNIVLNTLFSNPLNPHSSRIMKDQVSQPYKTVGKIILLIHLILYISRQLKERQRSMNCTVATIITSTLNLIKYGILICYCHSQTFEFCIMFKGFISYLYTMITSCTGVTRHGNICTSLFLLLDQFPYYHLIKLLFFFIIFTFSPITLSSA